MITPSLPTFSITSAIRSPISLSAAEMEATWAISSLPLTGTAMSWMRGDQGVGAEVDARFSSMALAPAATLRMPSCTMAWASTVAVVVPSPATSLVLVAASLRSCAPMFAKWIVELDLLGDGDAVVGDGRGAELLVERDVAALRTEGRLDRVGEDVDTLLRDVTRLSLNSIIFATC